MTEKILVKGHVRFVVDEDEETRTEFTKYINKNDKKVHNRKTYKLADELVRITRIAAKKGKTLEDIMRYTLAHKK
jgi:hypothetical protein